MREAVNRKRRAAFGKPKKTIFGSKNMLKCNRDRLRTQRYEKQRYMTVRERYALEDFLRSGKGVSWIARELGFCRQTIYNEMKRGKYVHTCGWKDEIRYSSEKGQQVHDYNQTAKGRPLKIGKDYEYARFLEEKMLGVQEDGSIDPRKRYSPGAALAEARNSGKFQTSISVNTLYSYIYKRVFLWMSCKDLWEKPKLGKGRQKREPRVAHTQLPSIEIRPKEIDERRENGHREMDLVVSCSKGKAAMLTSIDRRTKFAYNVRIPNKKAESAVGVFDRWEQEMGQERFREGFKTVSTDNGSEFLKYTELQTSIFEGDKLRYRQR